MIFYGMILSSKNVDFVLKNVDFPLKTVDFIMKTADRLPGEPIDGRVGTRAIPSTT